MLRVVILAIFISNLALGRDDVPGFRGDSGIFGPKYEVLLTRMAALKTQYPELVTLVDYGATNEGRTMRMIVVKRNMSVQGVRPTVVLDGTIHGDEFLNLEDRAPGAILEKANTQGSVKTFLDKGGVFLFIPIINPDGYDHRQRGNANGVDLNRDWEVPSAGHKGFKQVESRLLHEAITKIKTEANLQIKFNVDYHCCAGAVLHPYAYKSAFLPSPEMARYAPFTNLVKQILNGDVGNASSILGYTALGTTNDYFYEKHGSVSLTYEGDYGTEDDNFEEHLEWWESALSLL